MMPATVAEKASANQDNVPGTSSSTGIN
jgi:hypothetical protein